MKIHKSLLIIILLGLLMKLPALWTPLMGHFASYQSINGMMAFMIGKNIPQGIFMPQIMLIADSKPALHLLYFPLASAAAFFGDFVLGGGLDFWGRLQAAFFTALSTWVLFRLILSFFSERVALTASAVFTLSPLILVEGISFQNEAGALFFLLASFYFLHQKKQPLCIVSGFFFALAVISRIHFVLIFFALAAALLLNPDVRNKPRAFFVFALAAGIPAVIWYGLMTYWELADPARVFTGFFGQLGEGRVGAASQFVTGTFYLRILFILGALLVTPVLAPFLAMGLGKLFKSRQTLPFAVWFFASLATIILLPAKVSDHPFYLISALPAAALAAALGLESVTNRFAATLKIVIFCAAIVLSGRYFINAAWGYSETDKQIPAIGEKISGLIPLDDLIVAQYDVGHQLLYYSGRMGWGFDLKMDTRHYDLSQKRVQKLAELGYGNSVQWLEYLRSQNAKWFVISQPDLFWNKKNFSDYVSGRFERHPASEPELLIFNLQSNLTPAVSNESVQ